MKRGTECFLFKEKKIRERLIKVVEYKTIKYLEENIIY